MASSPELNGMPDLPFDPRRARRFLRRVLVGTIILLAVPTGLNAHALLVRRDIDGRGLLLYQKQKIARGLTAAVVLLGDSSLGNAVDARAFGDHLGAEAVSLALNGNYGYAGDRNLLDSIPAERLAGREIVLMHTADMLTRPPADLGSFVSMPRILQVPGDPRWRQLVSAAARYIWKVPDSPTVWSSLGRMPPPIKPATDYVAQAKRRFKGPIRTEPLEAADIRRDKVEELESVAKWCRARGIKAWYCHGPLGIDVTVASRPYFEQANRLIAEAGFAIVNEFPLGLGDAAVGDVDDHVHPDFKARSTAWHANRLQEARAGSPTFDRIDEIGGAADESR
jgi:hypothetical protein